MNNTGISAVKTVVKQTKNGCRLLSKQRKELHAMEKLEQHLPLEALYCNTAKVETDFGKGLKTITSYYDKDARLFKRIIEENKNGKIISKIIKEYSKPKDGVVKYVNTSHYAGDIENERTYEAFVAAAGDVQGSRLTKVKLNMKFKDNGDRLEKQAYEEFVTGSGRTKYIETSAKRMSDGQIMDTAIKGNVDNLEEISQDPYLYMRNYNMKDFAQSAQWYARKVQDVANENVKFVDKNGNYDGMYNPRANIVVINTSEQFKKSELVSAINHEFRHCFQFVQMSKLLKKLFNPFVAEKNKVRMTEPERQFALKTFWGNFFYLPFDVNNKLYRKNFVEIDAEKAGNEAKKLYEDCSIRLAKIFNGPDEMFCVNEDSVKLMLDNARKSVDREILKLFIKQQDLKK